MAPQVNLFTFVAEHLRQGSSPTAGADDSNPA
jgi:hypothetical protein